MLGLSRVQCGGGIPPGGGGGQSEADGNTPTSETSVPVPPVEKDRGAGFFCPFYAHLYL